MAPDNGKQSFHKEQVIVARKEAPIPDQTSGGIRLLEEEFEAKVKELLKGEDGSQNVVPEKGVVFRIDMKGKAPVYSTRITVRYEAGKVFLDACNKVTTPAIEKGWGDDDVEVVEEDAPAPKPSGGDALDREKKKRVIELRLREMIGTLAHAQNPDVKDSPIAQRLAKFILVQLKAWDVQKDLKDQLSSLGKDPHRYVASETLVKLLFAKPQNAEAVLRQQQLEVFCQKLVASEHKSLSEWATNLLKQLESVMENIPVDEKHVAVVSGGKQITVMDIRRMLVEGTQAQREVAVTMMSSLCNPKAIKMMANHEKERDAFEEIVGILDLAARPKNAEAEQAAADYHSKGTHQKFDRKALLKITEAMNDKVGGDSEKTSLMNNLIQARGKLHQQMGKTADTPKKDPPKKDAK